MGWTGIPMLTSGTNVGLCTDIQDYNFYRQFPLAIAKCSELSAVATGGGSDPWPRMSHSWFDGIIPAGGITENSLTDATQTWKGGTDDVSGNTYYDPWVGSLATSDNAAFAPTVWWLYIDDNDPDKCIRTKINSWIETSIAFDNIRDLVTAKVIPSIASLEGKHYYILGYAYALGSGERTVPWPNSNEWATGQVITYTNNVLLPITPTNTASPTHNLIRDDSQHWRPNEHAGRDLLTYGDDGFLKRVPVTSNTTSIAYFGTQTWTPATNTTFLVVGSNRRAIPNRSASIAFQWYTGPTDSYASHSPTDELIAKGKAAQYVQIPHSDPFSGCVMQDVVAMDTDVWTDLYDGSDDFLLCGRSPDKCYTPFTDRSIRGWESTLEAISAVYVPGTSVAAYDGATAIPYAGAAVKFYEAGINGFTGSTVSVTGTGDPRDSNQITVTGVGPLAYYPIRVHFTIVKPNGDYFIGRGAMIDATTLEAGDGVRFTHDSTETTPTFEGRTVYVSPGWTAYLECEFKYLFPVVGNFTPDLTTPDDGSAPAPVVPPQPLVWDDPHGAPNSSYGVGKFVKRNKSSGYVSRRAQSSDWSIPSGFAWEPSGTNFAFITGNVARYGGDNYAGPGISSSLQGSWLQSSDPLAEWYDHVFVGQLSVHHQAARDGQRFGNASAGGTFWLQDETKNWLDCQFFSDSLRTDSGTATSGSSMGLFDSSKDDASYLTTPTVEAHAYWEPARFPGFVNGPYSDFVVEVDSVSGTVTTTEYRLITAGTTNPVGVSWSQALVHGSASGKNYRIVEPKVVSRWAGRQLKLGDRNPTTGTVATAVVTLLGNGSNTLFFDPPVSFSCSTNTSYQIVEPQVGTTWKFDGTNHVAYSGSDTARIGLPPGGPKNFLHDSKKNLPTIRKEYGRSTHGDRVFAQKFKEFYAYLQRLKVVRANISWTSEAVDGVAENNENFGSGAGSDGQPDDEGLMESTAETNADTSYASLVFAGEDSGLPTATITTGITSPHEQGCHTVSLHRRYAYGVASGITGRFTVNGTLFAFAQIPGDAAPASCPNAVSFDDFSDPVLNKAWKSFGGGSGTTFRAQLGSAAAPSPAVWCAPDLGTIPTPPTAYFAGYEVIDGCVLLTANLDPP